MYILRPARKFDRLISDELAFYMYSGYDKIIINVLFTLELQYYCLIRELYSCLFNSITRDS